ncbi:hypothetical protein U9M48_029510 [Paspalum notatum var. saurae]|uniref:RING-type E3 ubiquitin transferase n=1 Tax=Paspalum notatum var. saurae TaxID=547442 RepID=A0AAQ3U137_PASNO
MGLVESVTLGPSQTNWETTSSPGCVVDSPFPLRARGLWSVEQQKTPLPLPAACAAFFLNSDRLIAVAGLVLVAWSKASTGLTSPVTAACQHLVLGSRTIDQLARQPSPLCHSVASPSSVTVFATNHLPADKAESTHSHSTPSSRHSKVTKHITYVPLLIFLVVGAAAAVFEVSLGTRMDASPSPPPPPSAIERKLNPGVVLLVAILAMVFFIFGLLNLLVHNLLRLRRARRRRHRVGAAAGDGSPTAFQGQLQQLFHLHDAGVDQSFIDALPVFPYRAVVGRRRRRKGGEDDEEEEEEPFDCAVCLCEFAADDKLRLLPTCGHAFHVPCIDAWLLSHSTCPLCRGSILADDAQLDPASSPAPLLVLESDGLTAETVPIDGRDSGRGDSEEAPKDAEEIVEVKLGKLRCVDGNASARDLAVDGTSSSNGANARGALGLGQRRCLSMGSYEYIMDEHAALRVAVKATPKRRPASSRSRRRHALSASDFGGGSKKGAWETAVKEAAASADAAGRCVDGAASLNKDSFSMSKIWAVPAAKREEDGRRPAETAGERRAASFRWPAMAAGFKKHHRDDEPRDVEEGSSGDNGVSSSLAEERPSLARTAMLWVAGGRQGSHSRNKAVPWACYLEFLQNSEAIKAMLTREPKWGRKTLYAQSCTIDRRWDDRSEDSLTMASMDAVVVELVIW